MHHPGRVSCADETVRESYRHNNGTGSQEIIISTQWSVCRSVGMLRIIWLLKRARPTRCLMHCLPCLDFSLVRSTWSSECAWWRLWNEECCVCVCVSVYVTTARHDVSGSRGARCRRTQAKGRAWFAPRQHHLENQTFGGQRVIDASLRGSLQEVISARLARFELGLNRTCFLWQWGLRSNAASL